jgi:hypothetical protein
MEYFDIRIMYVMYVMYVCIYMCSYVRMDRWMDDIFTEVGLAIEGKQTFVLCYGEFYSKALCAVV